MLSYRLIPTADLIPSARNSRTHSEAQIAKIASSIREFGFLNPIITDGNNGIVAGHGRVLAAQKLGLKDVPIIEAKHLTEAQKRAYVIADNRMALDAGWDAEMLKVELGELKGLNFDLALTGFELGEIAEFLGGAGGGFGSPGAGKGSLADRFLAPPFSVLNAREGWWQDRKRAWLALGIQSELGRGEQLIPNGGGNGSKARYAAGGASPGGSPRPSMNYSKDKARGDGYGRPMNAKA